MNFITVAELNSDIVENLHNIPRNIDIIVGIPRSGMLVATLISLYMNKPLSDFDSFVQGRIYSVGETKNTSENETEYARIRKVLIVEDSSISGNSIRKARERLEAVDSKIEYVILAAYITKSTISLVDLYFKIVSPPRCFEWNFMHHRYMKEACVDIDGVLCMDPLPKENDDGARYIDFIRNARTKYLPSAEIGWLVTSRLEKYRDDTEYWLKKNKIRYRHLYMMDLDSAEERRKLRNHARFKAEIFKKLHAARWFLESEPTQAKEIRRLTGKEVFCIEEMLDYRPNVWQKARWGFKSDYLDEIRSVLPQSLRKFLRKIKQVMR